MLDPDTKQAVEMATTIGLPGVLGRMVWSLRQTQAGKREFWSVATLIDMIIAVPSAFVGFGAWEALIAMGWLPSGLPGSTQTAFIGVAGYLGPYAIDAALDAVLRWLGKK